jgi:hypothetical protein
MSRAIAILSDIFFLCALPQVDFEWSTDPGDANGHGNAVTIWDLDEVTGIMSISIHMHPVRRNPRQPRSLVSWRLGVLLHEMSHGLVVAFSCHDCVTAAENVGYRTGGHGRAWHLLTAAVEKAAPRLLGPEIGEPNLRRLDEIWRFAIWGIVPSIHDVKRFGFL